MAYETDDICPTFKPVKTLDEAATPGTERDDPKSQATQDTEPKRTTLRPGDNDLYPEAKPLEYVTVSRPPDFKAGEKPDADYANCINEPKEERENLLSSPLLTVLGWGLGGGLSLWLYFQLAGLFKFVLECQGWRFWAALVIFCIPIMALTYAAMRFWQVFRKLPKRDQVQGDLDTSDIREKKVIKNSLKPYIDELPPEYVGVFKSERRKEVSAQISRLRKDSGYSDSGEWIDDFKAFQDAQEEEALDTVKTYCKLVALKTAACPWKAIDMVIVSINLTLMVVAIAKVYNRRVSKGGAFRLLCHWFANIYISGELGAITENAADRASDKATAWLTNGGDDVKEAGASVAEATAGQASGAIANGMSGSSMGETLTSAFSASLPILSKFAGKAAEGAVNAFLAYRMGRRAIDEFRFIKNKQGN